MINRSLIFCIRFSVTLLLLLHCFKASSQSRVEEKADTTKLYKDIEDFSKRNRVTKTLHKLMFKPNMDQTIPKKKKKTKRIKEIALTPYDGKIIRNINVITLDPFGYDIKDSTITPKGFVRNAGNALHNKTSVFAIKNLLLFKRNQVFDTLYVKESERLIRSQRYVRDVILTAELTEKNSDSVDIYIRVLDVWSIDVRVSASTSQLKIDVTDKNFMGLGHSFENIYKWYYTTSSNAYETIYNIPNIDNTYIGGTLRYLNDKENQEIKSVNVERKFYSPLTRWAGGVLLAEQLDKKIYVGVDSLEVSTPVRYNTADLWTGRQWQLFKGNSVSSRSTNLVLSARALQVRYSTTPPPIYDSLNVYSSENFYLAGIGISSREYEQEDYIFKYGTKEDVPVGRAYGIVLGLQRKNDVSRWYGGFRIAWGRYYPLGYISTDLQYGTFLRNPRFENGTIKASVNYFTQLYSLGNWRFRQFIKPEVTIGIRRYPNEYLTINDDYGIRGFNSTTLTGTSRILLTLQTQSYAPWRFLGFRFGPYFITSFAMLDDKQTGFKKSRVYSQFGFGFLIKNEYLVLNTFQVSVAFYPIVPGEGNNVIKTNPFRTTDFGFRDFDFVKPGQIVYE